MTKKRITDDDKRLRLGKMGEISIGNYLTEQGHKVTYSIDPYDSNGDMYVDGELAEVKTQVPWISKAAFTIRGNQLRKCRNVRQLYFVALPHSNSRWPYKNQGHFFKVDPETFSSTTEYTKKDEARVLIPWNQPSIQVLAPIPATDIELMKQYLVSEY